jgi:hypothetical protein
MSQYGATSPLTAPLTLPGTASLGTAEAGEGWPALLLGGLALVGGLIGAGLLAVVLAWRGDGVAHSFWNSPASLTAALVLTTVAMSVWIRVLSRPPPDSGRNVASDRVDGAGEEALERNLAPLRDLAASMSRMVRDGGAAMDAARGHSAEAVDAALRATARLAGGALDAEERLRATVLRAERLQAGAEPMRPADPDIIGLAQAVEATRRANQQAERLERIIPELMLTIARLSQAEAANASHTAGRLDAALAGLDRSAASLELHTNAIGASAEQAGVMIASLPEAASLVNAAAARLTQDSVSIATILDRGTAGLAVQTALLATAYDQTAMMLGALPEATLLVHVAADRLVAGDARSAQLLERLADMVEQGCAILEAPQQRAAA